MEEKKGHPGSSFVIGLAIGAAVGALVSTKKGRQILKDLSEYGLDYLGNVMDVSDIESVIENSEEEIMESEVSEPKNKEVTEEKPTPRKRLFKGIRK